MKLLTKKKQKELLDHIFAITAIASDAITMEDDEKETDYFVNSVKSICHHALEMAYITMGTFGESAMRHFIVGLAEIREKGQWPSKNKMEKEKKEGTI